MITAVNTTDMIQTDPYPAMHDTNNDLGEIIVCDNLLENYISVTMDGTTAIFLNSTYENSGTNTSVFSQDNSSNDHIVYLGFSGTTIGEYQNDHFFEVIRSDIYNWDLYPNTSNGQFENFEVTQYGPKIIGTFSGEVVNSQTGVISNAVGEFNVNL